MKSHAGKKPVRVHLLSGDSVLFVFDPKACVQEVFDQVCTMHSIKESHFFGLSAFVENEHRFLDLKQKISKYAPKEWGKELRRRGSDVSVQPSSVFTVQFQVQYFVEHPKLICDHQSRHHYYLQLKRNVLQSKVTTQDETIITLAATALHLDFGPYDSAIHTGHYFDPHEYVPSWFLDKWNENYLWAHLPTMHAELVSTSAFNAQADYIKLASCIDDVPVHYYKLYKTKKEVDASVVLGIFHQGIWIHHINPQQQLQGPHLLDFEFPWSKVGRLFFSAKRFEIYPDDLPPSRKLTYYTGSRSRSKYLLRLLRDTHSLHMSLSPFVQHMRKVDGKNNKNRYRESYISGMNLDERLIGGVHERLVTGQDEMSPESTHNQEDRKKTFKSYNSSTSHGSSHTSGIESDSKQKHEEAEEIAAETGDDNAFVDDFDPIEVDSPPRGEVICVTQEHLEAPPSKRLSVANLMDTLPNDSHLVTKDNVQDASSSKSEAETSEKIHENEVIVKSILVHEEPSNSEVNLTPCLRHTCDSSANCSEGILLVANTLAMKTSQLKSGCPSDQQRDSSPPKTKVHRRRSSQIPEILDSFPDVPKDCVTTAEPTRKFLAAECASDERISRPLQSTNLEPGFDRRGSKTFYDDTNTILRQDRSKSVEVDAFNLPSAVTKPRTSSLASLDVRSKMKEDVSQHNLAPKGQHHKVEKTCSADSTASKRKEKRHNKSRNEDAASLHVRHRSSPEKYQTLPPVNAFGTALTSNKSAENLHSTNHNVILCRSKRQKDIPEMLNSFKKVSETGSCKNPLDATMSAPSLPMKYPADSGVALRKMSDICHETIAAQRRKMAEEKNHHRHHHHHHHHEQRRFSDVASVNSRKPQNCCVGAPGFTPKKPEVLLRAKHNQCRHNRIRPVSYHVTTDGNHYSDSACLQQPLPNSRSSAYVESLKEVIV